MNTNWRANLGPYNVFYKCYIGCFMFNQEINRGYYMAMWRYKISLRVLKIISLIRCIHSWNTFQHSKRNFVSPSGHVMFYLLYKHQWNSKPFHLNIFLLQKALFIMYVVTCEYNMLYVFAQNSPGMYIIIQVITYQIGLSNIR